MTKHLYLEYRRGRWHYHYVLVVAHRRHRRRIEVRCLSDHPNEPASNPRRSLKAVYLHREQTRQTIIDEIEREISAEEELTRPSFAELAAAWLADATARGLALGTVRYMVPILTAALPPGPVDQITADQVERARNNLRRTRALGPRAVNHYMSIASTIFQRAIDYGTVKDQDGRPLLNPVAAVKRVKEAKRKPKRFTLAQVRALSAALDDYEAVNDYRTARTSQTPLRGLLLAALNSGPRPATTTGLRWEWWSQTDGVIHVPAGEMKADQDHSIIVWPVLEIYLSDRWHKAGRPANGWIFPSSRHPDQPVKDFRRQWARLIELANHKLETDRVPAADRIPEDAQFRHLRHTVASELLGSGLSLSVVADTLGNTEHVARKHYADLDLKKRRRLMQHILEEEPDLAALFGLSPGLKPTAKITQPAHKQPVN